MDISGKHALVLGASRGIGLAIAKSLAAQNVRLALPWFDWPEASEEMAQYFSALKQNHLLMQVDLRQPEEITALTQQIQNSFGQLDILINNIERGGMPIVHGSYHRPVNHEQWQLEMETTLHAKWLLFEHCQPFLKKSKDACVINISSIAGQTGRSGPAGRIFNDGYAAANRGVNSLTRTWARLGAPNIRVNEIMLGFIDTRHGARTRGWNELTAEEQQAIINHTLLKRTGSPEEVAAAVNFILKDADFMTGSTLCLDGGYLLGGEEIPPMPPGII